MVSMSIEEQAKLVDPARLIEELLAMGATNKQMPYNERLRKWKNALTPLQHKWVYGEFLEEMRAARTMPPEFSIPKYLEGMPEDLRDTAELIVLMHGIDKKKSKKQALLTIS